MFCAIMRAEGRKKGVREAMNRRDFVEARPAAPRPPSSPRPEYPPGRDRTANPVTPSAAQVQAVQDRHRDLRGAPRFLVPREGGQVRLSRRLGQALSLAPGQPERVRPAPRERSDSALDVRWDALCQIARPRGHHDRVRPLPGPDLQSRGQDRSDASLASRLQPFGSIRAATFPTDEENLEKSSDDIALKPYRLFIPDPLSPSPAVLTAPRPRRRRRPSRRSSRPRDSTLLKTSVPSRSTASSTKSAGPRPR